MPHTKDIEYRKNVRYLFEHRILNRDESNVSIDEAQLDHLVDMFLKLVNPTKIGDENMLSMSQHCPKARGTITG